MNKSSLSSRHKLITFIAIGTILFILFIFFCFPVFNKKIPALINNTSQDNMEIVFGSPIKPQKSDYILLKMRAENIGGVEIPSGSIAINIGREVIDDNTVYLIKQRSKFYIDGFIHNYYIPIGENEYYIYEWGLYQNRLKDDIESLTIEIPKIDGVNIKVDKIEFKKRDFFALDSYINFFFKKNFNITFINRYQTPAYIFIIMVFILYMIYISMFYRHKTKAGIKGKKISIKRLFMPGGPLYLYPVVISVIIILVGFSFYFIGNYFFTTKSYWESYKKYIIEGNLKDTYRGFNDFEDYVLWLSQNIPQENNIIVILKGDPVYISAEMAYNLYPRDIKFINTSDKNTRQIISKIKDINEENDNNYRFITILAKEDLIKLDKNENFIFIDNYSGNGGFLFKLRKLLKDQ